MSTKEKIMESTFKLLLEKGLIEVSLSEIINESQVGYGSIYYYFEDKDQLIQCVLNQYITKMFLNQLETVNLKEGLLDNLNEFYHKVLGLNKDNSFITYNNLSINSANFKKMILLTFEGQQKYEKQQEYFKKYNYEFTVVIEKIIRKAIENNEISKDVNVDEIVFNIKSNVYGIFFLWLMEDIIDVEDAIKVNIKYILNFFN